LNSEKQLIETEFKVFGDCCHAQTEKEQAQPATRLKSASTHFSESCMVL
jgi:hypothetical protein